MNWGKVIANISLVFGIGTSLGYLAYGDWKRALYFLLGAAITAVVVYLL